MASPEGTSTADDSRCKFILPRKQRQCRQTTKAGLDYCGQHLPVGTFVSAAGREQRPGDIRVQCPYGKHTVAAHQLITHMKTCNDKKEADRWANEPFHVEAINTGPENTAIILPDAPPELADQKGRVDTTACRRLAYAYHLGAEALNNLISRLDTVYKRIHELSPDRFSILGEEKVETLAANASKGSSQSKFNLKHGLQHASLVGNMDEFGLLQHPKDTMFIEFGAGKGYLTNSLSEIVPEAENLVMMDNQKFKLLADRGLRSKKMQRIRCDIADFEPCGVQGFNSMGYWMGHGKHLCGAATDLTLRCCHRYLCSSSSGPSGGGGHKISSTSQSVNSATTFLGLGIATCCHHRCCWQHYVAQDVVLELGFSPEEFEILSYFTSWALCGHGGSNSKTSREKKNSGSNSENKEDSEEKRELEINQEEESNDDVQADGGGHANSGRDPSDRSEWRLHHSLSREARQVIGQQSKRLIDYGRVEWLRRNGFCAQEVCYCDPESSGENRLILAKPT